MLTARRWYERAHHSRNAWLAPWHRDWWWLLYWDVAGAFYRALMWVGLYEVEELGYYAEGTWNWQGDARQGLGPELRRMYPGWRGFARYVRGLWP